MSEKKQRKLKSHSAVKRNVEAKAKNQEDQESRSSLKIKERHKESTDDELLGSSEYSLPSLKSPYIPYKNVVYSQTTVSQYESENHSHSLETLCSEGCPVYQIKNIGNAVAETLNSTAYDSTIQRKLVVSDGFLGCGTQISQISSNNLTMSGISDFETEFQSKSNQISVSTNALSRQAYKNSNQSTNQISVISNKNSKLLQDYYLSSFQSKDKEIKSSDTLTNVDKFHTWDSVEYHNAINSNIYNENFAYDAISDDEDYAQSFREGMHLDSGASYRELNLFSYYIHSFLMIIVPLERKLMPHCSRSKLLLFILSFLILLLFCLGLQYFCYNSKLMSADLDSQGSLFPFSLWSIPLFNISGYNPARMFTYLQSSSEPEVLQEQVSVNHPEVLLEQVSVNHPEVLLEQVSVNHPEVLLEQVSVNHPEVLLEQVSVNHISDDRRPALGMPEVHKYIKDLVKSECGNQDLHPTVKSLLSTVSDWKLQLDQMKVKLGQQTTASREPVLNTDLLHLQTKFNEMETQMATLLTEVRALHIKCEVPKHNTDFDKLIGGHQASFDSLRSDIDLLKTDLKTWQQQVSGLASSCVDRSTAEHLVDIHLTKYFSGLVGQVDSPVSPESFKAWLYGTFVSGDHQKGELQLLKKSIMFELEKENVATLRQNNEAVQGGAQTGITVAQLDRAIQSAILKYDADKVGLPDFALESAGGSILSTRCSENYKERNAVLTFFNIPIMTLTKTARTVIQPGMYPGECWAFRGHEGYVVIQLSAVIQVESFTLEHIPRNIAPNGKVESAPKEFSVIGLKSVQDLDGHIFGKYEYDEWGPAYQSFVVQNVTEETFGIVELRIHSNYGNLEYTCVYRLRVHGKIV